VISRRRHLDNIQTVPPVSDGIGLGVCIERFHNLLHFRKPTNTIAKKKQWLAQNFCFSVTLYNFISKGSGKRRDFYFFVKSHPHFNLML